MAKRNTSVRIPLNDDEKKRFLENVAAANGDLLNKISPTSYARHMLLTRPVFVSPDLPKAVVIVRQKTKNERGINKNYG